MVSSSFWVSPKTRAEYGPFGVFCISHGNSWNIDEYSQSVIFMSLNLQNPVNRQQTLVNRFNNSSSFSLQVYQPSWLTSLRARRALRMKNLRSCQNQKPQNPPATCLPARSLSHLANTMGSCVTGPYWTILLVLYCHDSLLYYIILYYIILYYNKFILYIYILYYIILYYIILYYIILYYNLII